MTRAVLIIGQSMPHGINYRFSKLKRHVKESGKLLM